MHRNIRERIEEVETSLSRRIPDFSSEVKNAFRVATLFMNINALGVISMVILIISLSFQIVFSQDIGGLDEVLGRSLQVLMFNRLIISIAAVLFIVATFRKMKYRLPESVLNILSISMPVFYLWVMTFFSISFSSMEIGLVPYLGMQFLIASLMRFSWKRAMAIFIPPLAFFVVYEWLIGENIVKVEVHVISSVVVSMVSVALSQILFAFWKRQFHFIVLITQQSDDLIEANEKLKRLADLDGLTGIPNRRSFDGKIQYEWARARREKEKLALIMIDIDNFKKYNDSYGHQKGDDALKAVAQAIQSTLKRSIDFSARYGGEEFVVLLPMATLEGACDVAGKIRDAVFSMKMEHKESEHAYVSVSMGVACMGHADADTYDSLLHAADMALYSAKNSGRNRVSC